ncbi:hypothetical protein [Candidatus Tisiphia endosymbiont of Hybos culiciformis]|uniref:hypothetical protein n=1 Tax=Candidatus Tisiphia endosymbiont of Hybos culiciformis TaxID=3139331 RepID=UPI003CCA9615
MRKIAVRFNKLQDIENLKKIMRNVYASNSDHLPDIAKFHLGEKIFIPSQVEKAELHIITASGTEIITFSKATLSFYLGTQHPFAKVAMTSENEGNYIVLPWNLDSRTGRDNLRNLINRIPSNVRELKYIIHIDDYNINSQTNLNNSSSLSQSLTSLASLHLSDIAAEDETEGLLKRIDDLEKQIEGLENKLQIREQAAKEQNWTLVLPISTLSNGGGTRISPNMFLNGSTMTSKGWVSHANLNKIVGNVTLDLINKKLTIDGNIYGYVDVA